MMNPCDYDSHLLGPAEVREHWSQICPLVRRGLSHGQGELTEVDVLKLLLEQFMYCFVTIRLGKIELVAIVEIAQYPRYRVARVVIVAGKGVSDASRYFPALEAFALHQGAVAIEGWCPVGHGHARLYKRSGFAMTPVYTLLRKDLRSKLQ